MNIKLSKTQWEYIGKQAGWIKTASVESKLNTLKRAVRHVCDPCAERAQMSLEGKLKVRDFKGEIKSNTPDVHLVIPRGPVVLSPKALELPGLKSSDDIGFRIEDDGRVTAVVPENEKNGAGRMVEKILSVMKELELAEQEQARLLLQRQRAQQQQQQYRR